ncbi:hypothetical protein [Desulfuromusa kysingii]|uniref:hypothetical protein n=1 Tax=Desulfuromusa kysingii TaxID=37625 RepID=UPI0011136FEB|nr:hypothetical protein [Desulfuromusa kysingii]
MIALLFCALALMTFGVVIDGELITVDDPDQMQRIEKRTSWNLEKTFIRKNTTGLYYRPLNTLSFTADKLLWDADTRVMHLENIGFHTLNALLVLLLTQSLLIAHRYRWHFSVLGGLLFLCHPLTAESVNWLSGRTDILAATFVFSSALCLMQFRINRRFRWLLPAIFFAGMGVLAKETSVAFLAGFGFLLWAQQNPTGLNYKKVIQRLFILLGLLSVAGGTAWFLMVQMRELILKGDSSRIGLTLRIIDSDWFYSFFVCLRALGFYFKKIFLPLPLNFAIIEVDPLYELLAISLLLLLVYLFIKRSIVSGYLLTAAALVSPAFVIAFNQIAWTPYAERYVYISLGFVLPVVVVCLSTAKLAPRFIFAICLLLLGTSFAISLHRSWQWSTNESLWADTVKKSPLSEKAWNNYGVALVEQGRIDEAEKCFSVAASKYRFGYHDKYDINMAVAMMERQDYDYARLKLLDVIKQSKGNSNRAVNVFLELSEEESLDRTTIIQELRTFLLQLATDTTTAAYYYQLGRLEKNEHNKELSQRYFTQAYHLAAESDPIRNKADKELTEGF